MESTEKVTLPNDQLDVLYDRQETLKVANAANVPDPTDLEETS